MGVPGRRADRGGAGPERARLAVQILYITLQIFTVGFLVGSLWGVARALRARPSPGALVALGGIWAVGLWMRLGAPAGPHDINDRSRILLSAAPELDRLAYGWGRPAFWRTLLAPGWWGDLPLSVLAEATAWTSSLMVWAIAAWLRGVGLSWPAVLTAAGLVAVDPLLVRFGHLDAPQIHEILPWLVGLAAWTAHTRQPDARWVALGTCALSLAATMRPESVLLLPLAAALAWAQGRSLSWRRWDTRAGLVVTAMVPLAHTGLLWSMFGEEARYRAGWGTFGPSEHGLAHWVVFQPDFTPSLLSVGVLVGLAVAVGRGVSGLGWVLALLGSGVFVASAHWSVGVGEIPLLARHQLRVLPLAAAVIGLVPDQVVRWGRSSWAMALGVVAIGARLSDLHVLNTPYTIHEEYAYFQEVADRVPEGCQLLAFRTPEDSGLVAPLREHPGHLVGDWRLGETVEELAPTRPCAYWYRSAVCSVAVLDDQDPSSDVCAAVEQAWALEPVSEAWLADRPWLYDHHRLDPVRVGLYRIRSALAAP